MDQMFGTTYIDKIISFYSVMYQEKNDEILSDIYVLSHFLAKEDQETIHTFIDSIGDCL